MLTIHRFSLPLLLASVALVPACGDDGGGDSASSTSTTAPMTTTDPTTEPTTTEPTTTTTTDPTTTTTSPTTTEPMTTSTTDTTTDGGGFMFDATPPDQLEQIDRMGMPAIATAVISSGMKDAYNAADPAEDAKGTFAPDIIMNVVGLHGALDDDLMGLKLTPCAGMGCVDQAAPLVIPDTLQIDTSKPSGFPNGRRLEDPVIDVTLAVVLLDLSVHPVTLFAELPLNPPKNDKDFLAEFPYLATPH